MEEALFTVDEVALQGNIQAEMSAKRKSQYSSRRSRKVGLPPGSLVYLGQEKTATQARITVVEYAPDFFQEREVTRVEDLFPLQPDPVVTWINVDGIHMVGVLEEFGRCFNLHPLLLEDIVNTEQRPKYEQTDNFLYVILKMFNFDEEKAEILTEQVSLVIGPRLLISFQEEVGDEFDVIRERLRTGSKRLKNGTAGYLAYALLDVVVDHYFIVLEKIGHYLESLEEDLLSENPPNILKKSHVIRRELIFLRKNIWPMREVINSLQYAESEFIDDHTQLYLRDIYDHTIQAMDTLETYRDLLGSIQDLYLSLLSNRMNEIMKVLTVMSSIFIPLTFIVGVYGMNFEYMPELKFQWGYPMVWLVMVALVLCMIVYFKKKRWI